MTKQFFHKYIEFPEVTIAKFQTTTTFLHHASLSRLGFASDIMTTPPIVKKNKKTFSFASVIVIGISEVKVNTSRPELRSKGRQLICKCLEVVPKGA